ncbi:hypothetical protein ABV409_16070, partial [Flagellimonas sp. DF-77]|uniref:hypothetical protein n=1 Tax=Flagellimonas algarum TaxID=3230298 RepID=UPI00339227CE
MDNRSSFMNSGSWSLGTLAVLMLTILTSFTVNTNQKSTDKSQPLPTDTAAIPMMTDCTPANFVRINPIEFGFPSAVFDGSLSAIDVDISSKWGLPAGSVLISVSNASVRNNGSFVVGDGFPIEFTFSGSIPVMVKADHSFGLSAGERDGIIALDGTEYDFVANIPSGIVSGNTGTNYFVENTMADDINNAENYEWSSRTAATRLQFYSTEDDVNHGIALFLQPIVCPDTDGDGVPDVV